MSILQYTNKIDSCLLLKNKKLVVGNYQAFLNGRTITCTDNTMCYYYWQSDENFLNDTNNIWPYFCAVGPEPAIKMGLSDIVNDAYWNIIHLPHPNVNGHSQQFASTIGSVICICWRSASGGVWTPWTRIFPAVYS